MALCKLHLLFSNDEIPLGTYLLHGKTGNSGWKIKWFAAFRLESFRKDGL